MEFPVGNTSRFHMKHAFWGPDYSIERISSVLKKVKNDDDIIVEELNDINMAIDYAARDIRDNKVIGWYQGASEWGPRALGNRSILANPLHSDMKNIINQKSKRERVDLCAVSVE